MPLHKHSTAIQTRERYIGRPQLGEDDFGPHAEYKIDPNLVSKKRPGSPNLESASRNRAPPLHLLGSKFIETSAKGRLSVLERRSAVTLDDRSAGRVLLDNRMSTGIPDTQDSRLVDYSKAPSRQPTIAFKNLHAVSTQKHTNKESASLYMKYTISQDTTTEKSSYTTDILLAIQGHCRLRPAKSDNNSDDPKSTQRCLPPQQELQARMKDPAREQRFRALLAKEDKSTPQGPPVQIAPKARAQLQQLIRKNLTRIDRIEPALRILLAGYEGGEGIEELARSVIKAGILLFRQFNQSDGTLQEQLTISEADFKQNVRHIISFIVRVTSSMQNHLNQESGAAQA